MKNRIALIVLVQLFLSCHIAFGQRLSSEQIDSIVNKAMEMMPHAGHSRQAKKKEDECIFYKILIYSTFDSAKGGVLYSALATQSYLKADKKELSFIPMAM